VTEQAAPPPGTTPPDESVPTASAAPAYERVADTGSTVPPDNLDPRAPLPSVPLSMHVAPC
jgi:hypothetical protein